MSTDSLTVTRGQADYLLRLVTIAELAIATLVPISLSTRRPSL